jgi:hypothetical protein
MLASASAIPAADASEVSAAAAAAMDSPHAYTQEAAPREEQIEEKQSGVW